MVAGILFSSFDNSSFLYLHALKDKKMSGSRKVKFEKQK